MQAGESCQCGSLRFVKLTNARFILSVTDFGAIAAGRISPSIETEKNSSLVLGQVEKGIMSDHNVNAKKTVSIAKSDYLDHFPAGTTLDSLREWVGPEAEHRDFTPDQAIGIAIRDLIDSRLVEIDKSHLAKLREYEAVKGTLIEDAVNEAISIWLECFAPVRLEALQRRATEAGGSC